MHHGNYFLDKAIQKLDKNERDDLFDLKDKASSIGQMKSIIQEKNIEEEKNKLDKRSDYFMEEILEDGVVKELWVSRKKPKRIMRATLKTKWFPVSATINE